MLSNTQHYHLIRAMDSIHEILMGSVKELDSIRNITNRTDQQKLDIMQWLVENNFPAPEDITCEKLPALAYIDDRAVRFTNWGDIRKRYI